MKKLSKNENHKKFISTPSFFYSPSFVVKHQSIHKQPINLYKNKLYKKITSPTSYASKSVEIDGNSFLSNNKKNIKSFSLTKNSRIKREILNIQSKTINVDQPSIEPEETGELINLNIKIDRINNEISELASHITKNEKKIKEIKEEMERLKEKKKLTKNEIENLLSQNESLEQIYNSFLNEITSKNVISLPIKNVVDKDQVAILDEDIQLLDLEKLLEQIDAMFIDIGMNTDNKGEIIRILHELIEVYNNEFNVDAFIGNLIENLLSVYSTNKSSISSDKIYFLIKLILKINSYANEISKKLHFVEKEYKTIKKSKTIIINELTNVNIQYGNKIEELNKNLLISKKQFETVTNNNNNNNSNTSTKTSNKNPSISSILNNSNHLRILNRILNEKTKIEKGIEISRQKSVNKIKENPKINSSNSLYNINPKPFIKTSSAKNSFISSTQFSSPISSPHSPIKKTSYRTAYNTFFSTSQNLSNNISQCKSSKNLPDTFCYYKILQSKDKKYNPLLNYTKSLEDLGYVKGVLSLNYKTNQIKITSNINGCKDNDITIDINKLNKTVIQKAVKDIARIHGLFKKYDEKKDKKKKILSIKKLINMKEIEDIKMEKNDKIKAALCNHFAFSLIYNNTIRIECVFVDFEDFRKWLNGISMFAEASSQPMSTNISHSKKKPNNSINGYNSFSNNKSGDLFYK